ncbi:MAG: hypothetical protein LQ338_005632 [Usnochroma carphineum]|nr:MAG: hypothetical protein LQ338_005632 [Usnochroma carphineum]
MCASPKRKRDSYDLSDLALAPSPTRLRTSNLPSRTDVQDDDINGDKSPRTTVAGHFQNLNLTGYGFDFEKIMEKPITASSTIADSQDSGLPSSQKSVQLSESQSLTPSTVDTTLPMLNSTFQPKELPLEIPETPRLQPTRSLSPVPSPVSRSKSPPPLNLWWADAEITGHDPRDPADDGYGINGVGFLPTPAMASARAERRKRQVAEWKNREAREARQRRIEARRRRDYEMNNAARRPSEGGLDGGQQRRVRFLEV